MLWANALGLYRPKAVLSASTQIRGIVIAWGAVLLFVTSILFLLKSGANYSRGATIGFGLVSLGSYLFHVSSPEQIFAERWQLVHFQGNGLFLSETLKSSQLYRPITYFGLMAPERSDVLNCHRRIMLVRRSNTTWRSSILGSGSLRTTMPRACCSRFAGSINGIGMLFANVCGPFRFQSSAAGSVCELDRFSGALGVYTRTPNRSPACPFVERKRSLSGSST